VAITNANLRQTRYYPEMLPDSRIVTVAANAESSALLDLREFAPLGVVTRLTNLAVKRDAGISLRVSADDLDRSAESQTGAWPDLVPTSVEYLALSRLRLALNNTSAVTVTDYLLNYGVWVWKPDIAWKLMFNIRLSLDEQRILDSMRDLPKRVTRGGMLPLDISRIIRDEYKPVIHEDIRSIRVSQSAASEATAPVALSITNRSVPVADQFTVLHKIAASPGTFGAGNQNIQLFIDRDEEAAIANPYTATMALTAGSELKCWIPFRRQMEIRVANDTTVTNHDLRFHFLSFPMTDIHRVRWGLASRDEVQKRDPGLYDAVMAGLL